MNTCRSTGITRRQFGGAVVASLATPAVVAQSNASPLSKARSQPVETWPPAQLEATERIATKELNVAYATAGPPNGPVVILLHGWPYDINSYVDVVPALAKSGFRVVVPYLRGFGDTRFLSAKSERNGQQSAFAVDVIDLMDALTFDRAIIAGFDWGARTANIVAALWPERCRALVSVSGYLIGSQEAGRHPLPPSDEWQWWYQYYFATERGREGYRQYQLEFNRVIWKLASPRWDFTDETYHEAARAFANPDHVDIVISNYRWRLGLSAGEKRFADLEAKLQSGPNIDVAAITLEGDANGAPHPDPAKYAAKFKAKYDHRTVSGGVGHNLPQEAPRAFVDAVVDVHSWA
ncbi:alpha/beta hydrolase [Rhizobium leguminosarum]|uniref:alpha/beta hydrolase n=1 Tax=Rhizobium leguminosarum TaxID=384 RepID=UPI0010322ED6|nr:alpha/beta hydrolase [Rhizobium leguminosarum]QIO76234.1 alpha/beta hydrolase [Rhizobium leguminosarum bv. trifolii]QIO83252.1 alpha/beta hydrolase [Rhizobium leguminosarum bv. trifolii]TAU16495.1 alpha/beta hydrolase [Rhizobium leguminosarum]TAU34810.1 alpha/beta hydrolase [Rhizobium leguminosarum]TAX44012.1 alpha/beta hydrolase [Rhizobium leguminosarum]